MAHDSVVRSALRVKGADGSGESPLASPGSSHAMMGVGTQRPTVVKLQPASAIPHYGRSTGPGVGTLGLPAGPCVALLHGPSRDPNPSWQAASNSGW